MKDLKKLLEKFVVIVCFLVLKKPVLVKIGAKNHIYLTSMALMINAHWNLLRQNPHLPLLIFLLES